MTKGLKQTAILIIGCVALWVGLSKWNVSQADSRRELTLVIFTADWCASCRETVPLLKAVAQEERLAVDVLDVDQMSAQRQATVYGLNVPPEDPPQAYLVGQDKTSHVFDGSQFKFGGKSRIRAAILKNLQQALK